MAPVLRNASSVSFRHLSFAALKIPAAAVSSQNHPLNSPLAGEAEPGRAVTASK